MQEIDFLFPFKKKNKQTNKDKMPYCVFLCLSFDFLKTSFCTIEGEEKSHHFFHQSNVKKKTQ